MGNCVLAFKQYQLQLPVNLFSLPGKSAGPDIDFAVKIYRFPYGVRMVAKSHNIMNQNVMLDKLWV